MFINIHEENPCLWDIHHKDYTKRNEKDIIYSSLTDVLETETNSIKTIINGLRSQLGYKIAKESKKRVGRVRM